MQTITTIPKNVTGNKELVIISRKDYEEMKSRVFPVIQLKGKEAQRLDQRAKSAIREHRKGTSVRVQEFLKKKHPHLLQSYGH